MSLDMTLTVSAKLDSDIENVRETNDTEETLSASITSMTFVVTMTRDWQSVRATNITRLQRVRDTSDMILKGSTCN